MSYAYIAEFLKKKNGAEVALYRTVLCRYEAVYIPEIDNGAKIQKRELTELFPPEKNPELSSILVDGKKYFKIILRPYNINEPNEYHCSFGADNGFSASIYGNVPDSRVVITHKDSPDMIDLPLRCFKDKLNVITVFEVIERLKNDYRRLEKDDMETLADYFASGLARAIEIVGDAFDSVLDLDGKPQLLHMTYVSMAGSNEDEKLVGMLHDLVEDTAWSFDDLLTDGFPMRIVDTLRLLTHDKQIPYMDYIRNIVESGNQVAIAVKINDLQHNLKRGRVGEHWAHVAKHEKALEYIKEALKNQINE